MKALKILVVTHLLLFMMSPVAADIVELETDTAFKAVYLAENETAATVSVAVFVLAGEVDVQGPEGLSHYLEHLMYWHADNAGGRRLHARGGNAWVNGIVTSYFNQSEAHDIPDMLEFIKRLYSAPELDRDFIIRERGVVAREYDLRVSENPDRRAYVEARKDLYNNHPVSRSVIGTLESIQALTIDQAREFHSQYYHPGNSVLVIFGNVKPAEAVAVVNEHLQQLDSGRMHDAAWRNEPVTEDFDKTTTFTDTQVNFERLVYLSLSQYPDPDDSVKNWYTLLLLNSIIDSALNGGIARPLRMDNFILRSFSVELRNVLADSFEFDLFAEPDKGVTLQQATTAIEETLLSIAEQGIPQTTLDRVRKRMLQTTLRTEDHFDTAYRLIAHQLSAGISPVTGDQHIENINSVSLADINNLVKQLANPLRRSIAYIKPPD